MKVGFVDCAPWDYTVSTPYERPLGGTQSAACYAAAALAGLGHEVVYCSHTTSPGVTRGVTCVSLRGAAGDIFRRLDLDAAIAVMAMPADIRRYLPERTRLILWTGHAHNQEALGFLRDGKVRAGIDAVAMVSAWQAREFQREFAIVSERMTLMRYAVSPAFVGMFEGAMGAQKEEPPVLAYTSTPFRGLEILLRMFPEIRRWNPGTRLRIFSSMKVYLGSEDAQFAPLYEAARRMEGVEYIGSLPQPQLARELKKVSVLAYPNIFAETSCIAVMEAMAAGCQVVTSALAALPETTAGFGTLIPVDHPTYDVEFINRVTEMLNRRHSAEEKRRLREQVEFVNREYVWKKRAREWEGFLTGLLSR